MITGLQALFNQDNGTGEIDSVQTNGFIDAAPALARWMARMPADLTRNVTLMLPGVAHNESTDSDAFDCRNAPGFFLTSSDWSYTDYTWHTNRDTYDKINFDNVKRNATLVALFAYQAAEDRRSVPRTRRAPPVDKKTGRPTSVPKCVSTAAKLGRHAGLRRPAHAAHRDRGPHPWLSHREGVHDTGTPTALTLNALTHACNQTTNRDPIMDLGEDAVRWAINSLRQQSLVFSRHSAQRLPRHEDQATHDGGEEPRRVRACRDVRADASRAANGGRASEGERAASPNLRA